MHKAPAPPIASTDELATYITSADYSRWEPEPLAPADEEPTGEEEPAP